MSNKPVRSLTLQGLGAAMMEVLGVWLFLHPLVNSGAAETRDNGSAGTGSDAIICPRIAQPPKIDGALDDPCWMRAATLSDFTKPLSAVPAPKAVTAKLCFDSQALYLAFSCAEPQPGHIKAAARDGGSDVWRDDCVEVWLRTGDSQLEFDQFIVNAAGARQSVRARVGSGETAGSLGWEAQARIGKGSWTAELSIPFSLLGVPTPAPGNLFQLKLGREDYAGGQELATWPPRSTYGRGEGSGRLYFETDNLLPNPAMSEEENGQIAFWHFGPDDRALFSSVEDHGQRVIRFAAPDRYAVADQSLRLKPHRLYCLQARVRGTAGVYLRARTSARKGEPTTAYSVESRPSDAYQDLQVRFPTGETGEALIILGNYTGLGKGEVFIADLQVRQEVAYEADGPAIPLSPGAVTVVTKVPVTDCRALRGFVAAPVDGRLDSYDWDMNIWEYGMRGAGAGVGYRYRNNDGLHITLADAEGVDAVQIRQGARVKLYCDAERYDDPGQASLVWRFEGRARTSRALFPERVKSRRFSFFDLEDGLLADVSFLRVSRWAEPPSAQHVSLLVESVGDPGPLAPFVTKRFPDTPVCRLGGNAAAPFSLAAKQPVHLVSDPFEREMCLGAIGLRLDAPDVPSGGPLTVAVQDPLNPRQELMGVDFTIEQGGTLRVVLDFPDQILPPATRLWLTLTAGAPVTVQQAHVALHEVPRAQALPQALAFRKFTMKGLFAELSEARQWMTIRESTNLEEFYRENHWGEGVRDLLETMEQCKALGPTDDTVRCYDEWVHLTFRDLPPFEPQLDQVPGAPEWAVLARQAWLTAREVPKWWLDHRLVPTGEFGGEVGDDTDLYQNFSDFPMFESDGVAAEIKRAAANLAELAESENLENGLNRRTMDSLHAYEEGVNHEALLLWWNYGDPIYFERCLRAARSMPALTVVTEKGHRHFKSDDCGAEDLRIDRPLGVDGGYHPLMLHPCLEVAWYNGSPQVLQFLREYGDAWVDHQQPGAYATAVDVKTEQAAETNDRPLSGGGQAAVHCFLYWLTDDLKYIRPFMDVFEKGEDRWPARNYVPELWHRGALDGLGPRERESVLRGNPIAAGVAVGDKAALCAALKADIAELQRFMPIYTDAEVFTDRVFLYAITNAARCYTGGFATRNAFHHTHAASWEGFGTDFAALVLRARRDHFQALIYNFREQPVTGRVRLWTLDHGRYRLTLGPDADGDDQADQVTREETVEAGRATPLALTLPPKVVTALVLQQIEKLDDLRTRPDLALSAREVQVKEGVVTGLVHNIGGGDAPPFTVALVDRAGRVHARQTLGPLAAPVDLEPKRLPFRLEVGQKEVQGWQVVVDPDRQVPEVFEENNSAQI